MQSLTKITKPENDFFNDDDDFFVTTKKVKQTKTHQINELNNKIHGSKNVLKNVPANILIDVPFKTKQFKSSTLIKEQSNQQKTNIKTNQKSDKIIETFNKYYIGKTIKPLQYEIVKSIIEKKDTMGILPTGYGKSVCYQLPYLLNPNKVVIVISPLISLMEDQKDKLQKLNIPVECFHSNKTKKQKQLIKNDLLKNMFDDINNSIDEFSDDDNNSIKPAKLTKSTKSTGSAKLTGSAKDLTNVVEVISSESDGDILYSDESINLSEALGMIIFFTPEYLLNCETWLKKLNQGNKLSLIALDEAHCISTWGHDFRPDYQGVYKIKEWVPNVPILALTATATKHVEEDIKTYLELNNPNVFKTSFDRPNLTIYIKSRPSNSKKDKNETETSGLNVLYPILNKYKNDFAIIYCKTRDRAESVCLTLVENNYNADVYHAGLSAGKRLEIQEKFASKKLNIIVATVAFGMGIDQNIHLVIHWGCPSDMESYYQEIGRAGRDGIESECYLFYDREDFRISRHFLKTIADTNYKRFKDEQISKMERFCMQPNCRRKIILSHFGETLPIGYACNKCDNCFSQQNVNNRANNNLPYPMFIIIKTIFHIKCKVGLNKLNLILKGSKSKIIAEFNKSPTFGLLKNLSDDQIKNLVNILIISGYLKEKSIVGNFGGTILETTAQVVTWYSNINKLIGNKQLIYDNCYQVLNNPNNKLSLSIPIEYNDSIANIKYQNTLEQMVNDFEDEFNLV
jgi:RecQ family ATP-dependent DNA helicase